MKNTLLKLFTVCFFFIGFIQFAFSLAKPASAVTVRGIETTFTTWRATITNRNAQAVSVWVWVDCWSGYQPNCPDAYTGFAGQMQLALEPGETKQIGPDQGFCFEGQITVGSQKGYDDYARQSFKQYSGTIKAKGTNGVCDAPLPTAFPTPTLVKLPAGDIYGFVYYDNNRNGVWEEGETREPGSNYTVLSGPGYASYSAGFQWFTETVPLPPGDPTGNTYYKAYKRTLTTPGIYTLTISSPVGFFTSNSQSRTFEIVDPSTLAANCSSNGFDFIIIIDKSSSMNEYGRMDAARKAAVELVKILKDRNEYIRIAVVSFGYDYDTRLEIPFTANYDSVISAINKIQADGLTCIRCGIKRSIDEFEDFGRSDAPKVAALLTDGRPIVIDNPTEEDILQEENRTLDVVKTASGIQIHTVGVQLDYKGINFLQKISDITNAYYYNSPTEGKLSSIFSDMATALPQKCPTPIPPTKKPTSTGAPTPTPTKVPTPVPTSLTPTVTQILSPTVVQPTATSIPPTPSPTPQPASSEYNLGIYELYRIRGKLFNDLNRNKIQDAGESSYTGVYTILTDPPSTIKIFNKDESFRINGITIESFTEGEFLIRNIVPGPIKVYLHYLPTGYQMIYPKNATPPYFSVKVGRICEADTTTGASCDGRGNIKDLNFAINNAFPWMQFEGMNARFEQDFINQIPATAACKGAYAMVPNATTSEGILYINDGLPTFGSGQVSAGKKIVGGITYPETPSTATDTSYNTLSKKLKDNKIKIGNLTSLNSCRTLQNCSFSPSMQAADTNVYGVKGNITVKGGNFPNNKNYIILIDGDLTIDGNIDVPVGSTVIFAASGDIKVTRNPGSNIPSCTPADGIEGYFIADKNFTIEGTPACEVSIDKMLKIEGSVIVNAAGGTGVFQNFRDLCAANMLYPSVIFKARPDFVLTAPNILKQTTTTYKEIAP